MSGPIYKLPLSQGLFALVDEAVFPKLSKFKWTAVRKHRMWYAMRAMPRSVSGDKKFHPIYLHHEVIGGKPEKGYDVNHIDCDGLNNLWENLEIITHRENLQKTHRHRSGLLPGAYKRKGYISRPYESRLMVNGKTIIIGYFATAEEASAAYRKKLKELL